MIREVIGALNSNLVRLHCTIKMSDKEWRKIFKFQSGATAFKFSIMDQPSEKNFKFQSGATAFHLSIRLALTFLVFKFQSGATAF